MLQIEWPTKLTALCALGVLLLVPGPALALRPYDSTDADVAKEGEIELELGPVGRRREGSKRIEVAPAVIGNFGLAADRELVIQGQRGEGLSFDVGIRRAHDGNETIRELRLGLTLTFG